MFLSRLSQPEKLAFYSLAYAVATAQGGIAAEEQALLDAAVGQMGLPAHPPRQELAVACAGFAAPESRRIALLELLMMAMIDGAIAEAELVVVSDIAGRLGVADDLRRAQDWAAAMLAVYRSGERFIRRPA